MKGHGEKLSRKQEQAIANLLTAPNIATAAQQTNISEPTLFRWLKDDTFQMAYRTARRAVVQHAIVQVQRATGEAVATLRAVMGNADAPANARVTAARAVLDMAVKAVEVENLERRLEALEVQMLSDKQ